MLAATAGITARSQLESSTLQIMQHNGNGVYLFLRLHYTTLFLPKDFFFDFDLYRKYKYKIFLLDLKKLFWPSLSHYLNFIL